MFINKKVWLAHDVRPWALYCTDDVFSYCYVFFLFCFFNWGDAPSLSRRAPNEGAKSIPKDHVIDLCDINASLLPRPGIEPGPAAWQARTLALHHVSGLGGEICVGTAGVFLRTLYLKQQD